jgi:hypothetical protein
VPVVRWRKHGFLIAPDLAERIEGAREYVYAIADGAHIKIGKSSCHPHRRMAELQTANPRPLCLVAYTVSLTERRAHYRLWRWRVRGEWFKASTEVLRELSTWTWIDAKALATVSEVANAV